MKLVGSNMLWSGAHDTPYIDSITCDIDGDVLTEEVTMLTLYLKDGRIHFEGSEFSGGGYGLISRFASYTFDIDGDGEKEYCQIDPVAEYPYSLFRFIVLQNEKDLSPKYYSVFNYSAMYSLAFVENADGEIVLLCLKNGLPSTATSIDIRIKDGEIVLPENGYSLTPYVTPTDSETWHHTYYFDPVNRIYADFNGDGKNETLSLGYTFYALATNSARYKTYWALRIENCGKYDHIPLGLSQTLEFVEDADGTVYIKETIDGSSKIFGEIVYENGKYSVVNAESTILTVH